MCKRYLKITVLALVMTIFVALPIYATDEVYADAINDAVTTEFFVEEQQDAVIEVLDTTSKDAGNEELDAAPKDAAELVTADQIEIVDNYWGLQSIQNKDQGDYCYFYAKFRKAGEEQEYYLYFTGFKYAGPNDPYPTAGFIQLIKDMGAAFLNGQTFNIYDGTVFQTKYGFVFNPIDAEKASLDPSTAGTPGSDTYPEGDYNMCWAASAANLIQFTSWTSAASEDDILSIFKNNISNYTGSTEAGIKWFFNGVNSKQTIDSNGNVVYQSYSADTDPQQRTADTTKYAESIAAENIIKTYDVEYYSIEAAMIKLMEALNNKNGIGLSVGFYDDQYKRNGGHAITCFGYIYDINESMVKALFTVDSEDSTTSTGTVNPKDCINIITMQPLNFTQFRNGMSTVSLAGYNNSKLDSIYIMTSYPNNSSPVETIGSKNINNDCDIIIRDLYLYNIEDKAVMVMDTTEGEDAVNIRLVLKNQSYAKVNGGNGALVLVQVKLYRGTVLLGTYKQWLAISPGKKSNPLYEITYEVNDNPVILPAYTAEGEEYYRLLGEILSIVDYNDEKTPVTEAYTTNNRYAIEPLIACYIAGKGAPEDDDTSIGVNTGDHNELAIYAVLLMIAILGAGISMRANSYEKENR